ncbi:MAG TPA: hypothetical protein VK802_20730 [Streptosporangiaceae bacterium]|nr:hypothetical protein [Streptosporangiaceae bacterium]
MPNRRQVQCLARKLGSGSRVRRPEGVSGFKQGGDGGFVTVLGTFSEVLGHLHRERAPGQEHVGGLAVERATNWDRGARSHCFANQVVTECQLVVALYEDVGVDKLPNRIQQVGDRQATHLGQVIDREPPAQGCRESGQAVRGRGHPQEASTHVVADAPWEAVFEEPRSAGVDCHDALILEAAEELHEEERVSLDLLGLVKKLLVRFRTENVAGDLCDGLAPEWAEADHLGTRAFEMVFGPLYRW